MKDIIVFSMLLSVMLGFVGVGRLCWDSKWFVILLFIYSLGAFAVLSVCFSMSMPKADSSFKMPQRGPLQLRPNNKEWIV